MNYHLDSQKNGQPQTIMIVGVGGTGGFVAEAVCRLLTGRTDTLILVDHDRVEPHNLLRQNFSPKDIGRFKSQALAERLSNAFDRPIGYLTQPYTAPQSPYHTGLQHFRHQIANYSNPDIMVGCVDNANARREMHQAIINSPYSQNPWLVDAGNGRNWGQVLIGNAPNNQRLHQSFQKASCQYLPAPTVQRPDLLTYVPEEAPDLDCAAAMELADQDPTINQSMAAITTQVVRRLLAGTCPFMALYADLDLGTLIPTYATPENVARITGQDEEDLVASEEQRPEPEFP